MLNLSLNETLSRTMVTSLSILLALAMLLILGPDVIFGLTIAIFLGIFVGTYSSIYISSPVLVWLGVQPDSFLRSATNRSARAAARLILFSNGQACRAMPPLGLSRSPTLMRFPC